MTASERVTVGLLGLFALPVVAAILVVLCHRLRRDAREVRIGLVVLALGYAMLALALLVESAGWFSSVWVYLTACAALIGAPYLLVARRCARRWWPGRVERS